MSSSLRLQDHAVKWWGSVAPPPYRGQLWVVGGFNPDQLDSCEYLDAASNTWMAGPLMNTPRYNHGLAVLDGQLWAIGGDDLHSCERLDADSNVWVTDLRVPLREPYCVAI